jgi:hypothetical protein
VDRKELDLFLPLPMVSLPSGWGGMPQCAFQIRVEDSLLLKSGKGGRSPAAPDTGTNLGNSLFQLVTTLGDQQGIPG